MTRQRFVSLKVTPGVECRVNMPPCSALEIKHAALAMGGLLTGRCTLECDLATHHFVLCSLPPGGHKQATLGTVITNDPDANAWLFFRARGPQTFHVLGRLSVDDRRSAAPASTEFSSRAADENVEEDWPSASNIVPSARSGGTVGQRQKGSREQGKARGAGGAASDDEEGEGEEEIEVLLPEGDDVVEYSDSASDASDDFVQWMSSRTTSSRQAPAAGGAGGARNRTSAPVVAAGGAMTAAQGGSRTQRRRAAQKRARTVTANAADEWEHDGGEEGAEKVGSRAPAAGKRKGSGRGVDVGGKKSKKARQ